MMMERRERADCTVSALACAAQIDYDRAYAIAKEGGRRASARFHADRLVWSAKANGIVMRKLPLSRQRTLARFAREYPTGRYYVQVAGHCLAVVNGVLADATSPNRRVLRAWRCE